MQKSIVFYDSECIMCSRFMLKVFQYDKNSSIYFSSLDSELFKSIKKSTGNYIPNETVVFYKNQKELYYKSKAVLQICKQLKFPFNLFVVFNLFPTTFLDTMYSIIAKNRKRWFGKSSDNCSLVQAKFSERVLK
jgi:predicted DCC family thiol-disulfide oxidoreductase YuxK